MYENKHIFIPTMISITIYNDSAEFKITDDFQEFNVPKGDVVLESLIITSKTDGSLIPFVIDKEPQEITIVHKNNQFQGIYEGTERDLLKLRLPDGNIAYFNEYDYLIGSDGSKSKMYLTNPNRSEVQVRYLNKSLSWTCFGATVISESKLTLQLNASVKNSTGDVFQGSVSLVSGCSKVPFRPMVAMRSMANTNVDDGTNNVIKDNEYNRYDFDSMIISKDEVFQIGTYEFNSEKQYRINSGDNKVTAIVKFDAGNVSVPCCKIFNYQEDMYLGSWSFNGVKAGEIGEIGLGESNLVVGRLELNTVAGNVNGSSTGGANEPKIDSVVGEIVNNTGSRVIGNVSYFLGARKLIDTNYVYELKNGWLDMIVELDVGVNRVDMEVRYV